MLAALGGAARLVTSLVIETRRLPVDVEPRLAHDEPWLNEPLFISESIGTMIGGGVSGGDGGAEATVSTAGGVEPKFAPPRMWLSEGDWVVISIWPGDATGEAW